MKKVGIVGWRGMVGSVLMHRMLEEGDFKKFKTYLFSTSLKGTTAPRNLNTYELVLDSNDIDKLKEMDIILTCQGGEYTTLLHPKLRAIGWNGFWVDAASSLRMNENSIIALDPLNKDHITHGLNSGIKDFIGGNCTVSLMLLAIGNLFKEDLVEWVTSQTYQAASGAGANAMNELLGQMSFTSDKYVELKRENPSYKALDFEREINRGALSKENPVTNFNVPLNLSLIPWIDSKVESGQSREEWKAQVEANKVLGNSSIIPIDGTCVRVGSLRCHAQALTIKLKKSIDISSVESLLKSSHEWIRYVQNNKEETLHSLTPVSVSGSLDIAVGRVRKMTLGDQYLNVFTLGDQLLWGAAEPLRRSLLMMI